MNRKEAARLGGLALKSKVSNSYFACIGHREGCNEMAHQHREAAAETPYPEMREHYLEMAAAWKVDTGTLVMVELWTKDNCEPRPARRRPNT
jgi:hypothetical protein